MRSLVLFTLLVLVAVGAVTDASKHDQGSEVLASRFAELEEVKRLNPKHRQLVERVVQAFESTIDKSNLNPARMEAVKQKAMDHFMSRLAEGKHKH